MQKIIGKINRKNKYSKYAIKIILHNLKWQILINNNNIKLKN